MDDVLAVSHSPENIMEDILLEFDKKDNKYGPPTVYLGNNVEPFQISDRKYSCRIKCNSYIAEAVKTDDRELWSGKRPHKGPLLYGYNPKLYVTDECDAKHMSRFQQLIGILKWAVELGSIDI